MEGWLKALAHRNGAHTGSGGRRCVERAALCVIHRSNCASPMRKSMTITGKFTSVRKWANLPLCVAVACAVDGLHVQRRPPSLLSVRQQRFNCEPHHRGAESVPCP